jgi:hypothetical protein
MKAIITTALNSGLGDMYVGIYQVYYLQEQLKQIGYDVKTIIDLSVSPYKYVGTDRSIFERIFKLNLLDNLEIVIEKISSVNTKLRETLTEVYKYEHIHTLFVDEIINELNDIKHVKHSWYYRDDLPKINFLSDEVTKFCEAKSKELGNNFISIHYRPFSSDNELNILPDLETYKSTINDILLNNIDRKVVFTTNKELVKNYLKNSEFKNVYINDFVFPNVHDGIRSMGLDDEKLFEILRESLYDMYLHSKSTKIYRISNWFSGFLSFSCLFNQTDISNRLRFYPEQPIIPL